MKDATTKQEYSSPQVRIVKVMVKNSILNVSSQQAETNSFSTVDDMRREGHFSINRGRR